MRKITWYNDFYKGCSQETAGKLKYQIDIHKSGVPQEMVEWCNKNCQHSWGWYFIGFNGRHAQINNCKALVCFDNSKEAIRFKLIYGGNNV